MLIGNVGRDPEVRYLEGNVKVATFTLATSDRFKDRSGELRENTEWHNIVAWRANADVAEKFIHKGTQIYVEGRLRTRSYTDQAGVKKFTTEIQADTIQLLGRRPDADGAPQQGGYQQHPAQPQGYSAPQPQSYAAPQQPSYSAPVDDVPGDDLPF